MDIHRYVTLGIGLLLAVAPVAACATDLPGAQSEGDVASTSSPSSSGSATAASPQGSPASVTGGNIPTQPGTVAGDITVRGTVSAGVELGCYLLRPDDGTSSYLLLGGDRDMIAAGGRLEVSGRAAPNMMLYCQQGTPFTVTSVRRI